MRGGIQRHLTFGAKDLIAAMEFYERWERWPGVERVVDMTALSPSRFGRGRS
jgi:hypothetical protein